jgi:glycosyltransferase involved in cell wall biosynthesis
MRDTISNMMPKSPIEIVHPYVQPDIADRLASLSLPEFDSYRALIVCEGRDHKGVDMLAEAWPTVRKKIPDASLTIVGEGHPDSYADIPGVSVWGYVENIVSAYNWASLYVQPARMDAFPVTVMEAMWAGRVPVVTRTTGSRSLVADISDGLIVEPQPDALAEGIISHFEAPLAQRRERAVQAKRLVKPLTEDRQQDAFVTAVNRVL